MSHCQSKTIRYACCSILTHLWGLIFQISERNQVSKHYHHQPINVPTVKAQAFLIDYTGVEQAIAHLAWAGMQPGPTA
jgi:hypothetical protein